MNPSKEHGTELVHRPLHGAEAVRLTEDAARTHNWKRWGPYLAERQWATVREDYSDDGNCWEYFPHDHSRSRAYRWGEDGLMGITDRECRLCFSVALWNGNDTILKERLFGVTGPEGNHGEDVKEEYFYLDSTPTHSYLKALYKYPHKEFPYARLVEENRRRTRRDPEFELVDTGIFEESRYFDVQAEYAKASPNQILIRLTVTNRGPEAAPLHLLPTLWFRNTWIWGCTHQGCEVRPFMGLEKNRLSATHASLGAYHFEVVPSGQPTTPDWLFTDNETNFQRLYGSTNPGKFVKDAFHDHVVGGKAGVVNPAQKGTKAALHFQWMLAPGESQTVCLRLFDKAEVKEPMDAATFEQVFQMRIAEADDFYSNEAVLKMTPAEKNISRQCYAGLLWSKQFYQYLVDDWIKGDPDMPVPPPTRKYGRNSDWTHLYSRDVLSMPDKWEYPWFAAWDLAFHMIPFARIDGRFAKDQIGLFLREWYMHPNGQIPAYEFALGDVNPPVHAWAAWRVYKIADKRDERDLEFLESVFQKLLLNFTWWVNRKDTDGRNLFAGGFLGLDNVGVFDRSKPIPGGGALRQADGTAWMAFYCVSMLAMALELARNGGGKIRVAYEDMASKFLEHFVQIADAMNSLGGTGLWDEKDGFYYDQIRINGDTIPLKTRSLVGILPLIAVEVFEEEKIKALPGFYKRLQWFRQNRSDLNRHISHCDTCSGSLHQLNLLAIPSRERLGSLLKYMLDENEFLSPYGVRSLSKYHQKNPYIFKHGSDEHRVDYDPGESRAGLFGGNSNWRGPVWFPVNYLIIEALERYYRFYGDSFLMEYPTGSGNKMDLKQIATELAKRLTHIFMPDDLGRRACFDSDPRYSSDSNWNHLVLFHEYFHGETGKGLGASHQTGWTALVVRYLEDLACRR